MNQTCDNCHYTLDPEAPCPWAGDGGEGMCGNWKAEPKEPIEPDRHEVVALKAELAKVTGELVRATSDRGRLGDLVDIYQGRAYKAESDLELTTTMLAGQTERTRHTEAERDEARGLLAEAAMAINCAGPLPHRIRVLKAQYAAECLVAREQMAALKAELAKVTEERDAAYTRCNELRGKCQSEYHRGYETGAVIGCRGAGRDRT